MKELSLEQTGRTPKIRLENGYLLLWGVFMPIDQNGFDEPIMDWIEKYTDNPDEETIINIEVSYIRRHVSYSKITPKNGFLKQ